MPGFYGDVLDRMADKFTVGDGCWEWTAAKDRDGYGHIKDDDGRTRVVHRLAYELFIGPIPDGLEVDHLCNVRGCIRPDHLEAVTFTENMRRRVERQTHCKHGHEFTPENTYQSKRGGRVCRLCMNAAQKRYKQRKKAITLSTSC